VALTESEANISFSQRLSSLLSAVFEGKATGGHPAAPSCAGAPAGPAPARATIGSRSWFASADPEEWTQCQHFIAGAAMSVEQAERLEAKMQRPRGDPGLGGHRRQVAVVALIEVRELVAWELARGLHCA